MDPLTHYWKEWSQQGNTEIRVQTEKREFSGEAVEAEKWRLALTHHPCGEETVHDREDSLLLQVEINNQGDVVCLESYRKLSGKTQTSDTWLDAFNRTMYSF